MGFQAMLDSLPLWGVVFGFAIISLIAYELGFRLGRWWQARTPEEKEGPTGILVGSLLGLLAFMLAITMGMASDRFDTRRGLVLAEANSIGTTYLRAAYLPEPASSRSQELIRQYAPLRTGPDDPADIQVTMDRSVAIQAKLWTIAVELAKATPDSDVLALYIDSLNETIDLHETRVIAGVYARVPETVLLVLFLGSIVIMAMVGYAAGLTGRRSPLTAVALIVVLGVVLALVVDLDRPRGGVLEINQQPLIDLQNQVGPPSS